MLQTITLYATDFQSKTMENEMIRKKINPEILVTHGGPDSSHIETAAYYRWLDRGRLAQIGDEVSDWIEAEKGLLAHLQKP